MKFFNILYLSLISSLSLLAMELPEQKLAVQDSSLRDQSMDAVIKQLNYVLLTDPDAIAKLPLNDESFAKKLKEKIIAHNLIQECVAYFPSGIRIEDIEVMDAEQQIIAVGFENGTIQLYDLKNKKVLKTIDIANAIKNIVEAPRKHETHPKFYLKKLSSEKLVIRSSVEIYCLNIADNSVFLIEKIKPEIDSAAHSIGPVWVIDPNTIGYHTYKSFWYSSQIIIFDIAKREIKKIIRPGEENDKVVNITMLDEKRLAVNCNAWEGEHFFEIWDVSNFTLIDKIYTPCEPGTKESKKITSLIKECPNLLRHFNVPIILEYDSEAIPEITNTSDRYWMKGFSYFCLSIDKNSNSQGFTINNRGKERCISFNRDHSCSHLKKLDNHHILRFNEKGIFLYKIPETYTVVGLLKIIKQQSESISKHINVEKMHPSHIDHCLQLIQELTAYCEEFMDEAAAFVKLQSLLKKYAINEIEKIELLYNLIHYFKSVNNTTLVKVSSRAFCQCQELQPLTIEEWKSLQLDLKDVGCIAFICTERGEQRKVILMPEEIAFQSPVLKAWLTGPYKEKNERTITVDSNFDSNCLAILKEFLFKHYMSAEEKSFIEKFDTIPFEILLLCNEWQIPNVQIIAAYFLEQGSKIPGELHQLFSNLPQDCYIQFLPDLLQKPCAEIIQIQLELLADMITNTGKYDLLFNNDPEFENLIKEWGSSNFSVLINDYAEFISNNVAQTLKWNPSFIEWIAESKIPGFATKLRQLLLEKFKNTNKPSSVKVTDESFLQSNILQLNDSELVIVPLARSDKAIAQIEELKTVLWNAKTDKVTTIILPKMSVPLGAFRINDSCIAISCKDGMIKIIDMHKQTQINEFYHENVKDIFSLNNNSFLVYSPTCIKIWDMNGDTYRLIKLDETNFIANPVKYDEQTLLGFNKQGNVISWDIKEAKIIDILYAAENLSNYRIKIINNEVIAWYQEKEGWLGTRAVNCKFFNIKEKRIITSLDFACYSASIQLLERNTCLFVSDNNYFFTVDLSTGAVAEKKEESGALVWRAMAYGEVFFLNDYFYHVYRPLYGFLIERVPDLLSLEQLLKFQVNK